MFGETTIKETEPEVDHEIRTRTVPIDSDELPLYRSCSEVLQEEARMEAAHILLRKSQDPSIHRMFPFALFDKKVSVSEFLLDAAAWAAGRR